MSSSSSTVVIKNYAIGNPVMGNLVDVPREDLPTLPKDLKDDKTLFFHREKHTTPNWIYITRNYENSSKKYIAGVVNMDNNKLYQINNNMVHPNPDAFGYENTRLLRGGTRRKNKRRQNRRSTTYRRSRTQRS